MYLKSRYISCFFFAEMLLYLLLRIKEDIEMNSGVSYSLFYDILLNLREYYHSYGRIDDSNA